MGKTDGPPTRPPTKEAARSTGQVRSGPTTESEYDMATYRLFFTQTASSAVEVEADDLDEALDLAYEELPAGLCAQCSGWGQRAGIDMSGDWEFDESSYYVDDEEVRAEVSR